MTLLNPVEDLAASQREPLTQQHIALLRGKQGPSFRVPKGAIRTQEIEPGEYAELGPVEFLPGAVGLHRGTLYIRNNLTQIESMALEGLGGVGNLVFLTLSAASEELLGDTIPLVLDFDAPGAAAPAAPSASDPAGACAVGPAGDPGSCPSASAAADGRASSSSCSAGQGGAAEEGGSCGRVAAPASAGPPPHHPTVISAKVKAKNDGGLPLSVQSLRLRYAADGCQHQGLGLDQCNPGSSDVELAPGQSMVFTVHFRPSCSASMVQETVDVRTSVGVFSLLVEGRVPRSLLRQCHAEGQPVLHDAEWRLASGLVGAVLLLLLVVLGVRELPLTPKLLPASLAKEVHRDPLDLSTPPLLGQPGGRQHLLDQQTASPAASRQTAATATPAAAHLHHDGRPAETPAGDEGPSGGGGGIYDDADGYLASLETSSNDLAEALAFARAQGKLAGADAGAAKAKVAAKPRAAAVSAAAAASADGSDAAAAATNAELTRRLEELVREQKRIEKVGRDDRCLPSCPDV